MKSLFRLCALFFAGSLAACVQNQEKLSDFYPISYQNLSGWDQENYSQLLTLFRQNCQYMQQLPPNKYLGGVNGLYGTKAQDWSQVCHAASMVNISDPTQAKQFFETWLQPYQYTYTGKTGKVTGYYEPEIAGSTVRYGEFQIPVYGKPTELIALKNTQGQVQYGVNKNGALVPYYSRAAIDNGALKNKNLEIAWVKNPVDLFFMQVQGSGRILLPDGKILRLGYAGKNGQPYTALGKVMIDQGLLNPQSVDMYSVKSWLYNHPQQAKQLMEQNKNYVFFRRLNNPRTDVGPLGAFGIPLTAGRSVAVDRQWIPLGVPLWLQTSMPNRVNPKDSNPWNHMVFAQDIGGGINGMNRIDLYTGWGNQAAWYAGFMNEKGKVFMLLPRPSEKKSLPDTTAVQPFTQ